MSVVVRQVRAEDFDGILKINSGSGPGVTQLDESVLRRTVALSSVSLVATDALRVVGYLLGISSSDPYEGEEFQFVRAAIHEPFLYIAQVAVCTEARRRSIGSRMYADLLRRCQALNIATLCCEVNLRPANPISMRFHERLGFERMGDRETSDGRLAALFRRRALTSPGHTVRHPPST